MTALRKAMAVKTQYDAMYRQMVATANTHRWHLYVGSSGYVLLRNDAEMDVPLPLALEDVQLKGWRTVQQWVFDNAARHFPEIAA